MFALSSSPTDEGYLEVSVMKLGKVTSALHECEIGDTLGVRGPYGNGFSVDAWEGKNLVFIDDLILTGGTLLKTREHILQEGAEQFAFAATHALPLTEGEENLRRLVSIVGEDLLVTNTVPSKTFLQDYPHLTIDCVPLICEFLASLG